MRALELRRFRPVGMLEELQSDFRLIAATNKDLESLVKQGNFREDLLYRLQGVVIRIPPLRERKEDIEALATFAIERFCKKNGLPPKVLSAHCLSALHAYTWPGNVRQLIHTLERACIIAKDEEELYAVHLPTDMRVSIVRNKVQEEGLPLSSTFPLPTMENMPTLKEWKKIAECAYLQKILEENDGNIRLCAQQSGLSRGHFYELLKKHTLSAMVE